MTERQERLKYYTSGIFFVHKKILQVAPVNEPKFQYFNYNFNSYTNIISLLF